MSQMLSPLSLMNEGPVIPVIVIHDAAHAVPLARALIAGGIRVLEVTLRTEAALESIRRIAQEVPEAVVGAGTIVRVEQCQQAVRAGARFGVSPGTTPALINAAREVGLPFLPGVATPSDILTALEMGLTEMKFFPAEASGGTRWLKALQGPFPNVMFCPTGGITPDNARDYLALPNVRCVGGSWLTPPHWLEQQAWEEVSRAARLNFEKMKELVFHFCVK